jgi:hypothetical protein
MYKTVQVFRKLAFSGHAYTWRVDEDMNSGFSNLGSDLHLFFS